MIADVSVRSSTLAMQLHADAVRQSDSDVTIGQSDNVSERNLACAILIRHKTLSDDRVQICLLSCGPDQLSDSVVRLGRNLHVRYTISFGPFHRVPVSTDPDRTIES